MGVVSSLMMRKTRDGASEPRMQNEMHWENDEIQRFQDVTDQLHSGEPISVALSSAHKASEEDALKLRRPKQS